MKAKLFRIISAVMAVIMMACCFTACTGNDEDPTTTQPNVDAPANDDITIAEEVIWDNPVTTTTNPSGGSSSSSSSSSSSGSSSGGSSSSNNSTTTTTAPSNQLSQEDMIEALRIAGYEYDAEQQVFYSTLNPWQRHFGFTDMYDQGASYLNMNYTTFKADFEYDGLLWRLQWWKGQYGILEGAEMGVYTKDPESDSQYYDCAADDQLLEMSFEYYRTVKDYNNKNMLFHREEQEHWWLTGFKVGYTAGSNKSVLKATLKAYNTEMADGIESGLLNVKNNQGVWDGFVKYTSNTTNKNFYIRNGNTFTVVWVDAGYENYQTGAISPDE